MTDYTKLAKALRRCADDSVICTKEENCGLGYDLFECFDRLHADAADAIEALKRELSLAEIAADDNGRQVEELQAQLPKRGEWILYYETEDGRMLKCSCCGMAYWIGKGREGNYCPNCGAKMEVQE